MLELGHAAGNTGPNGAEWDFEDISDLFIRIVLQIKKAESRPVWFLDLPEKFKQQGGVKRVDHFR